MRFKTLAAAVGTAALAVGLVTTGALADAPPAPSKKAKAAPAKSAPVAAAEHYDRPAIGNWSGIYVGASAGWIGSDIDVNWGPGAGIRDFSHSNDGAYFGGHFGIQHQFSQLVIGAEFNFGSRGSDHGYDTGAPNSGCPNPAFTCKARLDGMVVMIGGRLGWAVNDQWMVYGQGGYATATVGTNAFLTATNALEHTTNARHDGYYWGLGLEYALTSRVILGIDYKHINLGAEQHTSVPVGFAVKDVDAEADIVTARISYKFGREGGRAEAMK